MEEKSTKSTKMHYHLEVKQMPSSLKLSCFNQPVTVIIQSIKSSCRRNLSEGKKFNVTGQVYLYETVMSI